MNAKKLTRKHIVNIIVCSIILLGLIVAFICYVHEPNLTRDTDRKPDITFNGKTFDLQRQHRPDRQRGSGEKKDFLRFLRIMQRMLLRYPC